MKQLSKSKYTLFCQCPKALWMRTYHPEEAAVDSSVEARMVSGNMVGDLARGLFGPFTEVTTVKPDGSLDINAMIGRTQECITNGTQVICEASFANEQNYCAVDILLKTAEGYAIYEVKSSTGHEDEPDLKHLDKYAPDIAYQKWVLTQCGINVTGTYLVCIDSNYVLEGELDIQQLFCKIDMKDFVDNEYPKVAARVKQAQVMLEGDEPQLDLSKNCMNPYFCAFWSYCTRQMSTPSVFNLYRMNFKKKLEFYHQGKISFEDLRSERLSDKQQMQVECTLNQTEHIDKAGIRSFLEGLTYPLYFLDFETMQPVLPEFQGTHPYQQIPFQYSLHIIEHEGGPLLHKEYLGVSGTDPRRALAEQLCKDIPMNACTLAYNKAFECTRIKEMAAIFPDLAPHLLNIQEHIQDLLDPFQAGYCYVPAMGGSFSIKSVLPALFPDDPELNYHNLDEQVQNGSDAMTIFPRIKDMEPEAQQSARQALLNYCCLDTLAMVKVWEYLKTLI